jgi:hypothetical protein
MAFRRWFFFATLLTGAVLVHACSSSADGSSERIGPCVGAYCDASVTDAAPDHTLEVGTVDQQPAPDSALFNPLCGQGCNPDDILACGDAAAPTAENGGDAGLDAMGSDASDGPTPPEAGSPDAGSPDAGGRRDAEPSVYACQVRRAGMGRAASCGPAGSGDDNAPCVSSADCAPGWACVGDAMAALCRPYCCGGSESGDGSARDSGTSPCKEGNYCAVRSLRDDADSADPLRVPVCVPAEKCLLSEPYPCPSGGVCTCPKGTACTVVRSDGTTGCVEPGTGVQGEPCSSSGTCAANHLCSRGIDRCLKLCQTEPNPNTCGGGRCQPLTGLPANWGVCTIPSTDAATNRP